ncbi:hypothetical protein [Flavobacterium anhuiense]|uniref:hypothetical protein n=1 Tax=Flavobacterium anhuiense TaxID=459526 RepID=UPI003D98A01E
MFKHKFSKYFFIISTLILSFILFNFWTNEASKSIKLLKNNIKINGNIIDLKISKNHSFGIITLKIAHTNTKTFMPFVNENLYPYAIKDSVAEIYHYISIDLKKGMKVELDSDTRNINFYDKNKLLYSSEITIISEESNVKFVKENSIIYKSE